MRLGGPTDLASDGLHRVARLKATAVTLGSYKGATSYVWYTGMLLGSVVAVDRPERNGGRYGGADKEMSSPTRRSFG